MNRLLNYSLTLLLILVFAAGYAPTAWSQGTALEDAPDMTVFQAITSYQALPNGLQIGCGRGIISILALRDDTLRIRYASQGVLPEDTSWTVLPAVRSQRIAVKPVSATDAVGFSTGLLKVSVTRNPLILTISDLAGNVISSDAVGRPVEYHGSSFEVYKTMPQDEHYFGLGDKTGPLDRRNEAFTMWTTDPVHFQESTDPLYKSISFFIAGRRGIYYGILLDNTWRSSFDFGKQYRDVYRFGSEDGPLDYYFLYGPEPKTVLQSYSSLTGPPPLPPRWAFGFQQSRYSYYPESRVREVASRLRTDKIPSDVIYLDIDYQLQNRPFTVDLQRFPNLPRLIADLRKQHFHTIAITDLHIANLPNANYLPYNTGIAGDHFVKNPDGRPYTGVSWPGSSLFPDFTRKATREWWGGLYRSFYSQGIAGFWNDMNEPVISNTATGTLPLDVKHRIEEPGFTSRITTHQEIHNIVGMENSRATYEGLLQLNPEQRPFVLTRSTFAGGQRYAATWTGDNASTWNHLRMSTPMLLNLGLSGFAFAGDDIGGYAGTPQPDLLTRWVEVGSFNPIYRDHTEKGTADQEIWVHGAAQEAIRRRYIEERYKLLPYIYTLAEEASRTGIPMMRPLFLEFPQTTRPLDLQAGSEFLLGPSLLIAPAPMPDTLDAYQVLLPPGGWFDYWSGKKVDAVAAHNTLRVQPHLEQLPVFVRAGSILPMQPLVQSTDEVPDGPLQLRVYPGPNCTGSVYLDDGESFSYKNGIFLRIPLNCSQAEKVVHLVIGKREGAYQPWWHQIEVTLYDWPSPDATIRRKGAGTISSLSYDMTRKALKFVVPDSDQGSDIEISATSGWRADGRQ
jgi:alpha-glucosidase